jgi:hypothetical protein
LDLRADRTSFADRVRNTERKLRKREKRGYEEGGFAEGRV